jgi:hypothetical protein
MMRGLMVSFVSGLVCIDFNVIGNGGLNAVDHGGGVFPVGTVGENEVGEVDSEWIDVVHVRGDGGHGRVFVKVDE